MMEQQQNDKPFETEPIGFENKINYPFLYHQLFTKLNELHGVGRHDDAISHYNLNLSVFGGIFDKVFISNCIEIESKIKDDYQVYQLQRVEFSRLMTRTGIAPKPDIRIRYKAMWNPPKTLEDMSFDGKDKKNDKTKELQELAVEMLGEDDS